MLRIERHAHILQVVKDRGFIKNDELAAMFNVSIVTIRRDLKKLQRQNLITLEHGGVAAAVDYIDGIAEPLYDTKAYIHSEQKQAIGAAAATLVHQGNTVVLDSGTTTACLARSLKTSPKLDQVTAITNDVIIARELCAQPGMSVVVLGGMLRTSYYAAYGHFTEYVLQNLKANKVFLGIDAASMTRGISSLQLEEIPLKRGMIEISDDVILLADASKFGVDATYHICGWDRIDRVVTDDAIGQEFLEFFQAENIAVDVVSVDTSAQKS
ncbi:DeoR family transcriptional regulator [candidate division KSB3 bacterium]|uniref:DeoR family transcriptional regulator n=1 Tax=candidate division KSB3 bacterium TaxID=2044937 RepID=A0A9D5Q8T1_9BACT|nr:DeoR family transcriptional regulator [candidate division KSB3 bacterium]MBD3327166.1 DeoR family transcriptional regulator [candidate division KSB3 bacterium]